MRMFDIRNKWRRNRRDNETTGGSSESGSPVSLDEEDNSEPVISDVSTPLLPPTTSLLSETSEDSILRPIVADIPLWPWPGILILMLIMWFIYVSQTKKLLALKFSEYYYAKLTIASGYKTETFTGSDSDSFAYNMWEAVRKLWEDGAYILSIFVAVWSCMWPYVKLIIIGFGIIYYRKTALPQNFDWLSTIARLSYIDAWMVLIAAVALKFEYSGSDTKSEVKIVEIKVNIELDVWFQAFARSGAYCFMGAIALSQIVGYTIIKIAQQPLTTRDPCSNAGTTFCFGFDAVFVESRKLNLGFKWYLPLYLGGILIYILAILFIYKSMTIEIFQVIYDFDASYTVDKTYDGITFDKTFDFDKTSKKSYSLRRSIEAATETYGNIGNKNSALSLLSLYLLIIFPLSRLSCAAALWALPLNMQLHKIMYVV